MKGNSGWDTIRPTAPFMRLSLAPCYPDRQASEREAVGYREATMCRTLFAALLLTFAPGLAATAATDLAAPNSLFVQATAAYEQAEATEDADRRAALHAEARDLLERIVAEHPGSHLALMLVTGEQLDGLSLPLARASADLARLQAVNIDKVLAALESAKAATGALRAQNDSMRKALGQETGRVTALLIEQGRLRSALEQQQAGPDAGTLEKLDAANAEIGALKKQKASITALLTSEQGKTAALQAQVQSLTAANAAAAAAKAAPETTAAAAAGTSQAGQTQQAALTEAPAEPAEAAPTEPKISTDEIAAAIREALQLGTERVVAQVGQADGYNADPAIHIPLPGSLAQVAEILGAMGLGGLTDDVELRMNRAAEQAAPKAVGIFGQAIAAMKVEDIQGIMNGPDDAATQYFQGAMSQPLAEAMRPVIDQAMAASGAIQAYDDMLGKYKDLPLVPDVKADLTEHALQGAMGGLFHYLAIEEAAIRNDAVKRTTELLKKVFGT